MNKIIILLLVLLCNDFVYGNHSPTFSTWNTTNFLYYPSPMPFGIEEDLKNNEEVFTISHCYYFCGRKMYSVSDFQLPTKFTGTVYLKHCFKNQTKSEVTVKFESGNTGECSIVPLYEFKKGSICHKYIPNYGTAVYDVCANKKIECKSKPKGCCLIESGCGYYPRSGDISNAFQNAVSVIESVGKVADQTIMLWGMAIAGNTMQDIVRRCISEFGMVIIHIHAHGGVWKKMGEYEPFYLGQLVCLGERKLPEGSVATYADVMLRNIQLAQGIKDGLSINPDCYIIIAVEGCEIGDFGFGQEEDVSSVSLPSTAKIFGFYQCRKDEETPRNTEESKEDISTFLMNGKIGSSYQSEWSKVPTVVAYPIRNKEGVITNTAYYHPYYKLQNVDLNLEFYKID